MRATSRWLAVIALVASTRALASQSPTAAPAIATAYAPIGLFFASIEEGARIFTPTRLLPFDHPESQGHQFPTALQLHGPEFPLLLWMGERIGYHLWPTLERYPTEPSSDWPYADIRPPPDTTALGVARIERRRRTAAPLPGLRAALFDGAALIAFIVDTRGLTFAERNMSRATAMGLDLTRTELLVRVQRALPAPVASGYMLVVFAR